uniref:Uncharacterized protein n=1 Tax=Knipowitschia caucasica TaxID=637954 RepID=A0AAV2L6N8_KNICA
MRRRRHEGQRSARGYLESPKREGGAPEGSPAWVLGLINARIPGAYATGRINQVALSGARRNPWGGGLKEAAPRGTALVIGGWNSGARTPGRRTALAKSAVPLSRISSTSVDREGSHETCDTNKQNATQVVTIAALGGAILVGVLE